MKLKVYVDRMSQPSRAVLIFCKVNGIEFEEVKVDLSKRQHLAPEFKEVNPMGQVPAIVDGRFKLFESHAILIYLSSAFPGIPDHWYPADLSGRAKIHSVLDWHHSNLRQGAAKYVLNTVLGPFLGIQTSPKAASEAEKLLSESLSKIESIWLKGNGKFLLGGFRPSIADLSLVCEIMQLELVDEKDRARLLGPHKKVQRWIEDTKSATSPHFDEVHKLLFKAKARFAEHRSSSKTNLPSKISEKFKLVLDGWGFLSNESKSQPYNEKWNSGFGDFRTTTNGYNKHEKNHLRETFWTICNQCKTHYEYMRMYLNHTLLCHNCHEAFAAVERDPPPNVFKQSN